MFSKIRRLKRGLRQIDELSRSVDNVQKALGRVEARLLQLGEHHPQKIQDYEFKVFSQWGEDGIIQYLIQTVEIKNKIFVEFGIQDYKESNTRFLLQNN